MKKADSTNELHETTKQNEQRLLALIKATSDFIYLISADWKTISELDGRIFLADNDEADSTWMDKHIILDDKEFITGVINECIRDKKTFELEHRIVKADGSVGWMYSRAVPIFDQAGNIAEWIGATNDITERKTAEEESLELIDGFTEGSWIVDFRLGTIKCSEKWARRIGLDKVQSEEQLAYTHTLLHADDTKNGNSIGHYIENGMPRFDLEYRIKTVDSGYIWTQNKGKIVYNAQGNAIKVYAATIDITERKQAEEALHESEEKFRTLFNNLYEGFSYNDVIYNEMGDPIDYRYTEVNKAYEEHTGIEAKDIIGKTMLEIAPDVEPSWLKTLAYVAVTGKRVLKTDYNQSTRRYYDTISFSPQKGKIAVILKDVTKRKRAEEEREWLLSKVSDERERLETIINSIDDEVWISDAAGNLIQLNPTAQKVHGLKANGKPISDIVDMLDILEPDGTPRLPENTPMLRALNGETVSGEEYIRHLNTGELRYRRYNCAPIRDRNGVITGTVAVAKDITERKRAEEEKERLIALMDNNPSLIFLKDEDGKYVYLNKAYEKNFIPSGNWYGKTDFDFWPKESAEMFMANDAAVLNCEQTIQFMEDSTDLEGKRYCWLNYKFPFTDSKNRKYVGGIGIDATRLILAEEALKESEAKYRELVEYSPAGIYQVDFRTGRFTSINDSICMITGYSREELLNMAAFDILDRESGAKFKQRIDQWLAGKKPDDNVDYKVITKDGREIHVHLNVKFTKDEKGNPLGASVIGYDITERKRAEEALRESEEKYRTLFNSMGEAFWLVEARLDENGQTVDFLYLEENTMGQERTGKSMKGKWLTQEYSQFDRYWLQTADEVLRSGVSRQWESHSNLDRWYSFLMFKAVGEKNRLGIISQDISDRHQVEEAMRQSEERYRGAVQNTSAVILRVDPRGIIRFANKRALEFFGYEENELVGKHAVGTIIPVLETTGRDLAAMAKKISENPDRFHTNANENMRKGGQRVWMEWTNSGVYDDEGHLKEFMSVGIDATERRRAEEALRESEEKAIALVKELEEADKNKNQFISTLSHELRNPLAVISAGLELLDITQDKQQIMKAKDIMTRQMNHLCSLVDDLLDLTRISNNKIELKMEPVDLNKLTISIAEDHQPLFDEKEIELNTKTSDYPIFIEADPKRVKQIIGNLLNNAQKYTKPGGKTFLTLSNEDKDAVISVKDNGIGLSPEIGCRLFQPFFQANMSLDRSSGGLGLGLSITKGIVELHGGSVSAYSEGQGKGSEFIIRLPLIEATSHIKTVEEKQTAISMELLKLLIIEDNKDFADFLSTTLIKTGYQVEVSGEGIDGLKKARQIRPDIVICDIGLPGINGYEIAEMIREDNHLSGTYLIAMTGYAGNADLLRAKEAGFNRHIAKPVDLVSLQQILFEYANERGKET